MNANKEARWQTGPCCLCVCVKWLQIVDCMKHDGLIQLLADELLNGKG